MAKSCYIAAIFPICVFVVLLKNDSWRVEPGGMHQMIMMFMSITWWRWQCQQELATRFELNEAANKGSHAPCDLCQTFTHSPPPSKSLNAAFVLVSVPNTAVSQCCQQSVKSSQLNGQSGPRKHIKIYKISDRITMPLRNPKCDITENFGAIFLRGSMSHTVDSRNWLPWKCTVFLKSAFNFNFSDLLKKRQNDSTVMSHCI